MHSLEKEAFHSAIIDLKTDAGSQQVILREVQMHPHRPLVLHMDFQRIKATETLHMKIPLHFEGADVAPGVKTDGGILAHSMTELDITCLPKDLPEYIAVDVSTLGMNESLHLSDIQLPEGLLGRMADRTILTIRYSTIRCGNLVSDRPRARRCHSDLDNRGMCECCTQGGFMVMA